MKKVLTINTKYRLSGGEDTNIVDELIFLQKEFEVEYLEFNNNKITLFDLISFVTSSNLQSNKSLKQKVDLFKPDFAYIHNTWFKANLGIIKLLHKRGIPIYLKIHNFRYDCTKTFSAKKHLEGKKSCYKCGFSKKNSKYFNKYYLESYLKSFFIIIYGKRYLKILRKYPTKILVLNEFHKSFLIQNNVESSKILVSYNPIQIKKTTPNSYKPSSNYIIYAGRLSESKGVEDLINSFINSKIRNINLKILGTGEEEKKLISKYESDNIEFLGLLDNEKTLEYIINSRCVVTATKMYEGQPRLLTEASNFGVPSIYPNFGGMSEFFPTNYPLSFEQYNYEDLTSKFGLLNDENLLKELSKNVEDYITKILDFEKLKKSKVFK
tara:strand:+ start:246 stop:1388 length:1143 start_codon:yes stop_codon:yes gene_type:complete